MGCMFCLQVQGPIVGRGGGGGVVITGSSRLITDRQQKLAMGSLRNNDGDGYGYEN